MRSRFLLVLGLVAAGLAVFAWRAAYQTSGQSAPNRTYNSPVGQITLPTVDGTAGTVGADYEIAPLAFGFASNVPQVGDLAGDTGNGFKDRYDFANLNAFSITQAASNLGDLDSMDPINEVMVGGQKINPGFRFVHIGRQPFIWQIGAQNDLVGTSEVTVFPSLDHLFDPEIPGYGPKAANPPSGGIGNVLLEAAEFTVWGTNDRAEASVAAQTPGYFGLGGTGVAPNNKWFRASLTKIFADGFKDFNGMSPFTSAPAGTDPSPQEGDDFASQWQFRNAQGNPVFVKYVAVYANRTRDEKFYRADTMGNIPGNLAQSNEAEIDGIGFKRGMIPVTANVRGRVIDDKNVNGKIDVGEPPIPGVTVRLVETGTGTVTAEQKTKADGTYEFPNITAGNYRVTEINLPNYIDTGVIPGAGKTAIDFNNINMPLVPGEDSIENNFLDTLPPPDDQCIPGCFNSVDMWLLFDGARRNLYNANSGPGSIFILSLNRNALNDDEIVNALSGMGTAKERLEAQFVAAQLNTLSYPRTVLNRATCFYNGPNVIVQIPGNPRVIELLAQARTLFATGTNQQIDQLAVYLELINNITATRGIVCPFADP
ncbi:MAG TPA: SdrD B-like domain-containing protein [Blastocatellia bacterium]|nr:SdrD B-like domain-containing protein [Blastocatellia bacterium]HMV83918.1 SdrD B-like domain-containing protein [Blastocatellia bacterium]HMX25203.1 SdrD B-like domain-containing protein [Blastocatellia bacterium]HMY73485.1 SdrD B-like domain-containing protein [Blastocatellia bacterium]HMZ17356.1 SdrD B-like domain-containing protein [Blastocatellia bacterium]